MSKRSLRSPLVALVAAGLLAGAAGGTYAAFSSSTTSSGNTFSAAASFVTCPSTLSPAWMTGIEHGAVSTAGGGLFDYAVGATADAATKRTGSHSLRLAPSAGAAAYAGSPVSGTTTVIRFALRFPALPAANVAQLATAYSTIGSVMQLGYRASDQKLTLSWGGADTTVSTSSIVAGTWYVVDLRADVASNPRVGQWRINGAAQPASTRAESPTTVGAVLLGSFNTTDAYTAHVDDIVVSSAAADYPIGDGRVRALRPDGIAGHDTPGNFRHEDASAIGAASWARLDDAPMTSTADRVEQRTASATSYLGFTFENPSEPCVRAVSAAVAYRAGPGSANNAKTSVMDGTTERVVFSGDMNESALAYRTRVIAPSGSSWTKTAADGLVARVGYATDVRSVPYWEALMLEYEAPAP